MLKKTKEICKRAVVLRGGSSSAQMAGIKKGFSAGMALEPGLWVGQALSRSYSVCGMIVQDEGAV